MKYRLKIVPDATPNADGRWIDVDVAVDLTGEAIWNGYGPVVRWSDASLYLARVVPPGEHIVAYEHVP